MPRLRRFLPLFLLCLGIAWPASANVCTCSTGICRIGADAGWTGAASCTTGDDGPAQDTDAIEVAAGATLDWDLTGTRTYDYLWVHGGGTVTVSVSPVVMQFDGPLAAVWGFPTGLFFMVGDRFDDRGTFTSDGKDLTISWTGTGVAYGSLGPNANSFADLLTTNYTAVTIRGVERAATAVSAYSRGATAPTPDTDMVDCLDGVTAPAGGAPGDTIAFTTGKSQEFMYEVTCYPDQCTDAGVPFACCSAADATTECSSTACAGGPCDYQLTRNSTGSTPGSVASSSSWSSMVLATQNAPFGAGGALLQPTPVDSDADGVANGDGTLPAIGDRFAVFKPVLIQGGTNPLTEGITFWPATGGVDLKYIEFNKVAGNFEVGDPCDADSDDGYAALFWQNTKINNAEGAVEFLNIHNFASRQMVWEESQTDLPGDEKPQVGRKYRHIYLHDVDPQVGISCAAVQVIGRPIAFGIDAPDRIHDDITFEGLHIARWGSGIAVDRGFDLDTGSNARRVVIRDAIIHDWPGIDGYGKGCAAVGVGSGYSTVTDGLSVWNLGQNSRGCDVIRSDTGGVDSTGMVVGSRTSNAFVVNIDSNTSSMGGGGPLIGGVFVPGAGFYAETTHGQTLSNSYIKGVVGAAAWGGRLMFNFIKDVAGEDDATAPCATGGFRAAIHLPVKAGGNVITRSAALSCMESAFSIDAPASSPFTDRTRMIVSNLAFNMDTDARQHITGLVIHDPTAGTFPPVRPIVLYNNIFDGRGNIGGGADSGILCTTALSRPARLTVFYNLFLNWTGTSHFGQAIGCNAGATLREGYNRFYRIAHHDPVDPGDSAATDVDSDLQDMFNDRMSSGYDQPCESPDKVRGPWGSPVGALRYGIRSFDHYHPAVLPLMDPDAFKLRYNWQSCGAAPQDAIPR